MSDNAGTKGQGGLTEFDQLPAPIRKVLRDFPLNMDAGFALQKIREGLPQRTLLEMLERRRGQLSEFNPENVKRGIR